MRLIHLTAFLILLLPISCRKENSGGNELPVAKTEEYIALTLPFNSTPLDGSQSYDPNGTITSFSWTKISGPPIFHLSDADSAKAMVDNLVEGEYRFELAVTDNKGAVAKDTSTVLVIRDGESIQFNKLPPVSSPCILTIPNITDQLPLIFSYEVYIRQWYVESSSAIWVKIGAVPDRAVNPTLPENSYWYWYEMKEDKLLIHYPGNILCDWDGAFHDVYIKY